MDKLKQIPARFLEIWKSWSRNQKIIIVSAVAVFIAAVVVIAVVLSRPTYQELTRCEDYNEMNTVTSLLTDNGYTYQIDNMAVKVKEQDLTNAKMLIASNDIKPSGYSLDDALNSSLTTTESDKNKKYAKYLETKFENDITSLDGIKSASVTVHLSDDTNSFYSTKKDTTVAVTIDTNKTVGEDTAESIAVLLATAVGSSNTNGIVLELVNVDNSTGDIDYEGDVVVKGNVLAGFTVKATGDITVSGIVEGATVIAGGNITFNRGIQGMTRAVVKAGGNIVSKFIESAENVSAGGSIEADSILHSKVTAKSTIKASGRNGLIIGGDVKAVNMIEAKTIGNAMGTNTSVGVGVDPSMKRRVDELKNSLGKLGDNKIQLNQLLNALRKKQDSEGGLDEAKHELQMKTMRNVIMLEQEINKQKKELEELRCQIGEEKHACIKVSDAAYAGVKLTFGDQCMFLKQKYDYCQFVKEGADIKSAPI